MFSQQAAVTQPTHSLSTDVTLRHFGNIPHPLTHPRLLHVEKSHLHQKATQGERSQGISVCTGLGKYSSTESLSKATLLHKHKKYNPCLVKKQLPVFTLPAQKKLRAACCAALHVLAVLFKKKIIWEERQQNSPKQCVILLSSPAACNPNNLFG